MQKYSLPLLLSLLLCVTTAAAVHAEEEMDVDQADSLDFEAFHTDKKAAVKLWDEDKVEKPYANRTDDKSAAGSEKTDAKPTTVAPSTTTTDKSGKRYEIRELYTISGSERTGYTPSTVVQALYLQMQGLCPKGWKKLDERSEPDGSDAYYMYYTFECL